MAVAPDGDVFITDRYNSIIRKVTPDGVVTTLAGLAGEVGAADGIGAEARFNHPESIAVDRQGRIYVADTGNHTIRCISPIGRVTTLAGSAAVRGNTDGKGSQALFDLPASIAVDSRGTVYVASDQDTDNIIRKISPEREVSSWSVQKWIRPVDIDSLLVRQKSSAVPSSPMRRQMWVSPSILTRSLGQRAGTPKALPVRL
jgi:DNA-binding beta-propeller fold protein YncE